MEPMRYWLRCTVRHRMDLIAQRTERSSRSKDRFCDQAILRSQIGCAESSPLGRANELLVVLSRSSWNLLESDCCRVRSLSSRISTVLLEKQI